MKCEVRKYLVVVVLVAMLGMLMPAGVWAEDDNGVSETASQQINTGISDETQTIISESAQEMTDSAGRITTEVTGEDISTGQQQENNMMNTSMNMSEFEQKLQQFQSKYPNNSIYNEEYAPTAYQCQGYGRYIAKHVFGIDPYIGGWQKVVATQTNSNVSQIRIGDFIRFRNGSTWDHTIFITNIVGDQFIYTDCNSDNHNIIKWNQQISKTALAGKLTQSLHDNPGLGYFYHYTANPVVTTPTDTAAPSISNVQFSDINTEGFTVNCTFNDDIGVAQVVFWAWTEQNDQDDRTRNVVIPTGNTASFRVRYSDHNNESGNYIVHVYALDAVGNSSPDSQGRISGQFDFEPPEITNIRILDINAEGFTVNCTFTDNVGVSEIVFFIWSEKNGQDDVTRIVGTTNGSTGTYRVKYSERANELGKYVVHAYAYDGVGNSSPDSQGRIVGQFDFEPPVITNAEITDISSTGYTVKCKVSDDQGIDRVQFPSWTTDNGLDDVPDDCLNNPVCSGKIEGDTVTYRVKDSDHNYQKGEYATHIYAIDQVGNQTKLSLAPVMIEDKGIPVSKTNLGKNEYILIDDATSWSAAQKKAEELGGHLATITSEKEQTIIENLIKKGQREAYFLGATDREDEGKYVWLTGEAFEFAKWANTQPDNNQGSENYLEIYRDGYWNDNNGNEKRGFIVEIEGISSDTNFIAFLGKDTQINYYEYSASDLNNSYLAYQINPALASAKMYQQFLESGCKVVGLKDITKGYMDYSAAANASLKAQMKGEAFNINTYLASSDAKKLEETIGSVKIVDKDGNVQ